MIVGERCGQRFGPLRFTGDHQDFSAKIDSPPHGVTKQGQALLWRRLNEQACGLSFLKRLIESAFPFLRIGSTVLVHVAPGWNDVANRMLG